MKKEIIIFLVAALCVTAARAQKETEKFSVGFGIEAGVPTGAAADAYTTAFGLTVRLSLHEGPGFVTLTSGLIGFAPKTVADVPTKVGLEIPLRFGYKYIIQHHFFVMGELGYSDFNSYYGHKGNVVTTSIGSMTIAPSIGYQANAFEIGLRYDISTGNGPSVAGIRLGFNF
jgi:hypothetical protein